jgi:pimeloyl-ACP methyl ester carboxylesterase
MDPPGPFVREAGAGPGVVCLHSNASTSAQWRGLLERLAPHFLVLAPDSYGAGKSPEWPLGPASRLQDEVAFIEPVLARAGTPLTLVGHSYGAAIALRAALAHPGRIRALALYEPTLFSLLDAEAPLPNDADGIRLAVARAERAMEAGDPDTAAGHFIDYWMGEGSWARMPASRRAPIAASVRNLRRWGQALFEEPTPLEAFRSLEMPVLFMTGGRSPRSAHGVARLLTRTLPNVEVLELAELGHMGPITHPDPVNEAIARFLERMHPRPPAPHADAAP